MRLGHLSARWIEGSVVPPQMPGKGPISRVSALDVGRKAGTGRFLGSLSSWGLYGGGSPEQGASGESLSSCPPAPLSHSHPRERNLQTQSRLS